MTTLKTTQVSVKFSAQEKQELDAKAKEKGLSLAKYIRYKVLHEEVEENSVEVIEDVQLNKHEKLIMRFVIAGYLKLTALAKEKLPKNKINDALEEAKKYYKILNIEKIQGEWDMSIFNKEQNNE